ncbi:hypothetical protein [Streptomyces sp. CA-132043]|uniref:hypothetical protein n=1 Tax=Streptomyces sp. CA-132043 TaxID=3240048 RepID=UPI003D8F3D3B
MQGEEGLRKLRHVGINVTEIAGDELVDVPVDELGGDLGGELVKGRGGPRCMPRPVYRPLATAQQARP